MKSHKNINLMQRKHKGKHASLKWLMALRKTGGMTRKLRRDR